MRRVPIIGQLNASLYVITITKTGGLKGDLSPPSISHQLVHLTQSDVEHST